MVVPGPDREGIRRTWNGNWQGNWITPRTRSPPRGFQGGKEILMTVNRDIALSLTLATILPASLALAPAASASAYVGIRVNVPPPPLRHEVILVRPGPRHVWVAGHWDWSPRRRAYVWIPGV